MKTYIFDPKHTCRIEPLTYEISWKNKTVGVFWVEATLLEVYRNIFNGELDIPFENQTLRLIDNPIDYTNFYFWISRDLSVIYQSFAAFPHCGMNSEKNRYISFPQIEIQSLQELKYIDLDKFNAKV